MQRLVVFNSVTLDGYFTGADGDLGWAHKSDPEWDAYVAENASSGTGLLLFGRLTYQMMAGFWPTPAAKVAFPVVADKMNSGPKAVVSRSLDRATWNNTRLLKGDLAAAVARLKQEPGGGITILGSGSIVAQLAPTGLIDEYQLVLIPVALGRGRTMFEGLAAPLELKPVRPPRSFANGNVVLSYAPA